MKRYFKSLLLVLAIALSSMTASAQQVNTLYFMENAPFQHYINPAMQPLSNIYVSLPIIGYTSLWAGNNSLTMSDIITKRNGTTMWGFSQQADGMDGFLKKLRQSTLFDLDAQINLLSFGFRIKEAGYFHFTLNEKFEGGASLPKDMFNLLLGGGTTNIDGNNHFDLKALGFNASMFTELGLGYSHQINEQWSVGGKLKVLLGQANLSVTNQRLDLDASLDEWAVKGNGIVSMAVPGKMISYPTGLTGDELKNFFNGFSSAFSSLNASKILKMLKPSGAGVAFDLGVSYKPIEMLRIDLGVTDLGVMHWSGARYKYDTKASFTGADNINYKDLTDANGKTNLQPILDSAWTELKETYSKAMSGANVDIDSTGGYWRMPTCRLNVGVEANFWENRVGVGIISRTRFFNRRVYEEVTLGASFRPYHWINIAASYSFLNGRWSNLGLALGLVTYEGVGLTIAADYVPMWYAKFDPQDAFGYPYKSKGLNVAVGLNVVIGHNRDKDKDGVKDRLDLCPNTPRGVQVDKDGCPLDTDGDGVPDYLDLCPDTPSAARAFVDEDGCPVDSDGDGVPDYLDACPDTPAEAFGSIDEKGCPIDSDGDGVPDYRDKCPDTPREAIGKVDADGCPLDSDHDKVPDYRDKCPDTPADAIETVDENGCEQDTDKDGVPDWRDDCPNTPLEAAQTVNAINERGCEKDTDEDGVPDWRDKCPGTPKGASVDKNGCEKDTDGDGVPDWRDECPDTPREAAQVAHAVDSVGCLKDSDGDGVPDYQDACPLIAGSKDNRGCPEIKREIRNLLKKAMQGIQFETAKSDIKPVSFPLLNEIADAFKENPSWLIEVQGHTDNVGKADYNQDLSERRANSVRDYLIKQGVPAQRLTAKGYGLTMPIADNKTAAGRKENRRVEFVITFEEVSYETVKTIVE